MQNNFFLHAMDKKIYKLEREQTMTEFASFRESILKAPADDNIKSSSFNA